LQSKLVFELTNGRKHRWVGAVQAVGGSLETSFARHRVEALQLMQGEFAH